MLKCPNILHLRTLLPFGLGAILILTFTTGPNFEETLAKRRDLVRAVFQQRLDRIEKVRKNGKSEDQR